MNTARTKILGTRETPEVYAAAQDAAHAAGLSTSEWISRRLRNNLRRTGRLAPAEHGKQSATAAHDA